MAGMIASENTNHYIQYIDRAYESNFDDRRLHIVDNGLNLPCHNISRYVVELLDAERVLNRYRRNGRDSIASQGRYCLDISLNTGPARRVGSGDSQYGIIIPHRLITVRP